MPQLIEFAVIRHVRFWNDSKNHSAGYDNGAVVKLVRAANRRTYDGSKPKVRGFACDAEKLGFNAVQKQFVHEKVVAATDRFRTLIAICNGKVVGYIDVTYTHKENEPFDLLVLKEYRRMGYGRKLLAKALEMNRPNGMMLLVEMDNEPAIRLYESMGFVQAQGENNLTAHWKNITIHDS